MSWNIRAVFQYPDTRVGGGALDPADIAGCAVSMRVVPTDPDVPAPDFTLLDLVAYPNTELVQLIETPGKYELSFVCVLKDDLRSTPVVRQANVVDDSPPSPMQNVVITVE